MTGSAPVPAGDDDAAAWGARLADSYRRIGERAMRDLPIYNDALGVEAVGFHRLNGMIVGIIVTPWFMNVVMPADAVTQAAAGATAQVRFPTGEIEFTLSEVEQVGRIASCSLFSPMFQFADMLAARATAEAALSELMRPAEIDEAAGRRQPATSTIDRRSLLRGTLTERRA